jgi:hypothetical protein
LLFVERIDRDLVIFLLELLETEENPTVLKGLGEVFVRYKEFVDAEFHSRVFERFRRVFHWVPYSVQIGCVRSICEYFSTEWIGDMGVFEILLGFVDRPEVSKECMEVLGVMVESGTGAEKFQDLAEVLERLVEGEYGELAERILALIDKMRR